MPDFSSPPSPALSVVVAVRDGWDGTFALLLSLLEETRGVPAEIIVVDDGSSDETPLAVPRLSGLVSLRNDSPQGLARAAAAGAALARGEVIAFLGNGAEPRRGCLRALLAALDAEPRLAAAGPVLLDATGAPLPQELWPDGTPASLPHDGLAVRAEHYRAAGGLDPAFVERGGVVDLCRKLRAAGARLGIAPEARLVLHAPVGRGLPPSPADDALLATRWPAPAQPALPSPPGAAPGDLLGAWITPHHDGHFTLFLEMTMPGQIRRAVGVRFPYTAKLQDLQLNAPGIPPELARRRITVHELRALFTAGYDPDAAARRVLAPAEPAGPARVAFTILRPDLMGGGSINVFRWVNWLAEAGAEVAVYSDVPPPAWVSVNARWHAIRDPSTRYAAIGEPVVMVYSVLELPTLLQHVDRAATRVFHLCQGAEEFHYGRERPQPLDAPNAAFDLLNRIPVGRLVVSPHLASYFARKYGQQPVLVPNGVDLDLFTPGDPRPEGRPFTVLVSGNPTHALKGVSNVGRALEILARRHPGLPIAFVNVCGEKLERSAPPPGEGFAYTLRCGLSGAQMRDAYRSADVYVNASWYEGFGFPSLEAMACGTPVVQTDNRGLDGIVEHERECLMVPFGDPAALADALDRIRADPALRDRLVRGGRETAARNGLENQRRAVLSTVSELTGVPLRDRSPVTGGDRRPTFSVMVPCYNQAHFLGAALDSLLAQTDPDWEALVVDDGSSDDTSGLAGAYAARDPRVRPFRKENGGVASALNRALQEARGDWICWLSSDDLFLPDKLAVHREGIRLDAGVRFMHTNYRLLREPAGVIEPSGLQVQHVLPPLEHQVIRFLHINYFNGISVAVHRSVFDAVGGFDLRFRYGQDYDLWLRASARFRTRFIDRATCITRLHPSQGTALFNEAGIYDSARAAAEFLNTHPLEDLFPTLDLSQPDQAMNALVAALHVRFQPASFITRCGFAAVLEDRILAWLSGATPPLRDAVQAQLREVLPTVSEPALRAFLGRLAALPPGGHSFERRDLLAMVREHLRRLERTGPAQEAAAVERYLRMIADTRSTGLEARAP